MQTRIAIVQTTVDDEPKARQLADELVASRLAACVQITPMVHSVYRWQGALEHATEWLLTIKTSLAQREAMIQLLEQKHPYEVPEILAWDACASEAYARWVAEKTGGKRSGRPSAGHPAQGKENRSDD